MHCICELTRMKVYQSTSLIYVMCLKLNVQDAAKFKDIHRRLSSLDVITTNIYKNWIFRYLSMSSTSRQLAGLMNAGKGHIKLLGSLDGHLRNPGLN